MRTVPDIIKALGGPTVVGRACGFRRNPGARGSDFVQRKSVPVRYWTKLVNLALSSGLKEIDYQYLALAHEKQVDEKSIAPAEVEVRP